LEQEQGLKDKGIANTMGIEPMKEVCTPQLFASMTILGMVTIGENPLYTPIDEVANLEKFTFDRKWKQIVRQTHK
jgi:hypothetical protein